MIKFLFCQLSSILFVSSRISSCFPELLQTFFSFSLFCSFVRVLGSKVHGTHLSIELQALDSAPIRVLTLGILRTVGDPSDLWGCSGLRPITFCRSGVGKLRTVGPCLCPVLQAKDGFHIFKWLE